MTSISPARSKRTRTCSVCGESIFPNTFHAQFMVNWKYIFVHKECLVHLEEQIDTAESIYT